MEYKAYIKNLIIRFAEEGSAVAFSCYDGKQVTDVTYSQFAGDILEAAGYLTEQGLAGKHIAVAAPNSYRWAVVFFAVAAVGSTVVPMNQELPADILQWQCRKADVSLVCYSDPKTAAKLGALSAISFDEIRTNTPLALEKLYAHEEDETVVMMFTSGTTGKSKAVMLSGKNLVGSVANASGNDRCQSAQCSGPAKRIASLPLYHIGSLRMMLMQLSGTLTVAMGRGAKYIFMDMPKLNPTHADMVPAIAESLARIIRGTAPEKLPNYVGSRFVGFVAAGAALKPSVAKYLLDQGIKINVLYGMTETAGDGTWCELDEAHIGTIGKPDGSLSLRIEDGEILLRSEGIMKGYYKDPEETAKVIVDGWLYTGDMGFCDADGYYYITGRKKNVIILSNGENVNPEEIEASLSECERIEECLVYSDGKGICADVFSSDRESADGFISQYNSKMPKYRQIYKVNYTDDPLPKTGSGKIKRKENL